MRVKVVRTKTGFNLETYDDDRRNRTPLTRTKHEGEPLFMGKAAFKQLVLGNMEQGAQAYAKKHAGRGYTANGGNS